MPPQAAICTIRIRKPTKLPCTPHSAVQMKIALTSVYTIVRIHNVVVVVIDATSVFWATLSGTTGRRYASRGSAATRITTVARLRASGIVAVVSLIRLLSRRQSVVGVFGSLMSRTCRQNERYLAKFQHSRQPTPSITLIVTWIVAWIVSVTSATSTTTSSHIWTSSTTALGIFHVRVVTSETTKCTESSD